MTRFGCQASKAIKFVARIASVQAPDHVNAADQTPAAEQLARALQPSSLAVLVKCPPPPSRSVLLAVVRANGLWIVIVSSYAGRVQRRNIGSPTQPCYRLYIGWRDQTHLIALAERELGAARYEIAGLGVPVRSALYLPRAHWTRLTKGMHVGEIAVYRPRYLLDVVGEEGPFGVEDSSEIVDRLQCSGGWL